MILHGAKIAYDPRGPLRLTSPRGTLNLPMESDAVCHLDQEITRRMEKGKVLRAGYQEHVVMSPIGAVPKPSIDGVRKWRTIHHLSHPEGDGTGLCKRWIASDQVTLRYYDLDLMFRELGQATREDPGIAKRRVLWKVDLKDAYRHIVVERGDAKLLGFFWPGLGHMYETQLSFGGRSAPFIFNLVAEAFEWILRSFGLECNHYLDDSFGWLDKARNAQAVVAFVTDVADRLGLATAPHKTALGPIVEVLGVIIDCDLGVVYIATGKLEKIRAQIREMENSTDLIQIQSLTGSLVFVTRVCTMGKAFLRRLFDQIKIREAAPFSRRRLTQDARRELRW